MTKDCIGSVAFVGEVDAGKSALIDALIDQETQTGKTQAPIFYRGGVIDTPGEFVDNRAWNGALLSTISTVKTIVILQPATAKAMHTPSGLLRVYPNKNIVGVVSKTDEEGADIHHAAQLLKRYGVPEPYFYTSIHDQASIEKLYQHLLAIQANRLSCVV